MYNQDDEKSRVKKLFNEYYFLISCIMLPIVFCLLSIPGFRMNSDDYWNSYWPTLSTFIAIISATGTFYLQQKSERERINNTRYYAYKEKVVNELTPLIMRFGITEDRTPELEAELKKDLVRLISVTSRIDETRVAILGKDALSSEDAELSYFKSRTDGIIGEAKNKGIVNAVKKVMPDWDIDKIQESSLEVSTPDKIGERDRRILGYWIIKEKYARNAEYLVGVSTRDKRIVGAYKLEEEPEKPNENSRILFNATVKNRIFLEKDNSENIKDEQPLPGLENWTAQNPVLYYKRYLESKGIELTDEDLDYIDKKLGIKPSKFAELSSRDIIVVRTYKFDE